MHLASAQTTSFKIPLSLCLLDSMLSRLCQMTLSACTGISHLCTTMPQVRRAVPILQQQWTPVLGGEAGQRLIILNADANVKLGHYKECGASSTLAFAAAHLMPQLDVFFSPRLASLGAALQRANAPRSDAGSASPARPLT